MKLLSVILSAFLLTMFSAKSQEDNYQNIMSKQLDKIGAARTAVQWQELANSFERIANAEKNKWLPFYYAAYCQIRNGETSAANKDETAEKAEQFIKFAETLSPSNAELFILKKMNANLRMSVDVMGRYMIYGPIATESLNRAKKIEPENPRIYLLEGKDLYYTPKEFGGSKEEAKKRFDRSLAFFSNYKSNTPNGPAWGLEELNQFLLLYK